MRLGFTYSIKIKPNAIEINSMFEFLSFVEMEWLLISSQDVTVRFSVQVVDDKN